MDSPTSCFRSRCTICSAEAGAVVPAKQNSAHFSLRFSTDAWKLVVKREKKRKREREREEGTGLPVAYQIQSEQSARLLDHLLIGAFLRRIGWWRASDRLRPRPCSGSRARGHCHVPLHCARGRRGRLLRFLLPDRHSYRRLPKGPSPSHSPSSPRCLDIIFIPSFFSFLEFRHDIYTFINFFIRIILEEMKIIFGNCNVI